MCEIFKESELNKKSLGIFKPVNIDFYWEKAKEKDQNERESYYAQHSLLNKDKRKMGYKNMFGKK